MPSRPIARPLGPTEEMFWRFDAVSPLNFAVTARIVGELDPQRLRAAVDAVQRRHPLLRVRVEVDADGAPSFVEGTGPIRIEHVDAPEAEVWARVEAGLNTSIDAAAGPMLLFSVLRHGPAEATIQIVFHHAISDGRSATFLLRDLLRSLAQQERGESADLEVLEPAGYYGDRIPPIGAYKGLDGLRTALKTLKAATLFLEGAGLPVGLKTRREAAARDASRSIFVEARFLDGDTLRAALARAKSERTTMQCVLNAALSLAVVEDSPPGPLQRTACTQVVDIRGRLVPPVGEDMGCFATGITSLHLVEPGTRFWDFAREVRAHMDESIATPLPFFHPAVHSLYTNVGRGLGLTDRRRFSELMTSIHPEGLAVSNLGRVEVTVPGSPVRVTQLAFATNTSVLNDLSTSALTYDGRMTWAFNGSSVLTRERIARIADRSVERIIEATTS